ncbi:MAG: hypothetical protein ACLUKE_08255 [Blautia wexlerae]
MLDDKGVTYSYQWYKDNQTLDGQTGGTLTVSEAGTYKVGNSYKSSRSDI